MRRKKGTPFYSGGNNPTVAPTNQPRTRRYYRWRGAVLPLWPAVLPFHLAVLPRSEKRAKSRAGPGPRVVLPW